MSFCGGHGHPVFDNEQDYKEWLKSWDKDPIKQKTYDTEEEIQSLWRAINILKLKLSNVYEAIHHLGIDITDSNINTLSHNELDNSEEETEYMKVPTDKEIKDIYKEMNSKYTQEEKELLNTLHFKKEK